MFRVSDITITIIADKSHVTLSRHAPPPFITMMRIICVMLSWGFVSWDTGHWLGHVTPESDAEWVVLTVFSLCHLSANILILPLDSHLTLTWLSLLRLHRELMTYCILHRGDQLTGPGDSEPTLCYLLSQVTSITQVSTFIASWLCNESHNIWEKLDLAFNNVKPKDRCFVLD